jgi:hypothetical protein
MGWVAEIMGTFTVYMCPQEKKLLTYAVDPEADFLNVIGSKVFRVFLLVIHNHSPNGFYSPLPP